MARRSTQRRVDAVERRRQLHQHALLAGYRSLSLAPTRHNARRVGGVQSVASADGTGDPNGVGGDWRARDAGGYCVRFGRRSRVGGDTRLRGRTADRGPHRTAASRQEEVVTRMASSSTKPTILARRDAVKALLAKRHGALVISGLGSPTYDVHAAGDRDHNYYLWGAMGAAALIGLGLAQAQPKKRVLVITGDGEQLMALGGLA